MFLDSSYKFLGNKKVLIDLAEKWSKSDPVLWDILKTSKRLQDDLGFPDEWYGMGTETAVVW